VAAIRVVNRKQLVRVALGSAVILVVAGLGTLMWDGPMGTLLRYSVARLCPVDAPSSDCVATLPATVSGTWTDYGEGEPYETLLRLDVPGAPAGATRNPFEGTIEPWLTQADAERLGIEESVDAPAGRVEVAMFDGEVVEVTGAGGETAATRYGLLPTLAAGELFLMVLTTAAVLAGATALWRRRADRRSPHWLRPAIGTAAAGAFAGFLTTVVTSGHVAESWAVPVLGGAALVAVAPVAFLGALQLREPFAAQVTENHGAG
jgi:hypothetical protein